MLPNRQQKVDISVRLLPSRTSGAQRAGAPLANVTSNGDPHP